MARTVPRKTTTRRVQTPPPPAATAASRLIDQRIGDLGGWRGETLARMRALIHEADPEIAEEWKWRGTPVWSHGGRMVCTGETYKQVVKLTFAHGARIAHPSCRLFNASLDGNVRRAIDIREGETVDARAFKALVKAAVASVAPASPPPPAKKKQQRQKPQRSPRLRLLSGGNPQIAKAEGDAPVQAYIAAMPGWKRGVGERLDALVARHVPGVRKAVKWNSPLYGAPGRQDWFLSFHVFTRYVKVTFFRGALLQPAPSGGTPRSGEARWVDIHEDDGFDEATWANWLKQAAAAPGWDPGGARRASS